MAVMQKGDPAKKLDLVFRIYDSDKSGMLEGKEIRTVHSCPHPTLTYTCCCPYPTLTCSCPHPTLT